MNKMVILRHSSHLGSASWITNYIGDAVQHLQYLPYGEPYVDKRTSGYSERFRFTGKERDEETGYGYFGARYMDHELMTMWLSVDPLADKYPNISPYNYCMWNPIRVVDPNGMDTLLFNKNGKYQKTILSKGTPVGKMKRKDGSFICFYFADPENDVKSAKDPDFRVQIVEDKTIKEYIKSTKVDKYIKLLKKIGYSNDERKYFALMFLANHSNAGTNPNDPFTLDYTCRLGLTDNILYVTKVGGEYIGHNGHNFGNFLWGASANILEVPLWIALLGAHYNNIKSKDENGGKLDSLDDQFSISLGHKWSRRNKL